MNTPKTKRGAVRQANALIRAYIRKFSGGGLYGFDWPTLRLNDPDTYAKLREIDKLYKTLPE